MSRYYVGIALAVVLMLLTYVNSYAQTTNTATQNAPQIRIPLIGEDAPSFTADTTQGKINFPADYKGKWIIFFSHPADFTPVCTTEFMTFAKYQHEYDALNTKLVGLSVDTVEHHKAWLAAIAEKGEFRDIKHPVITYPIVADPDKAVSNLYGMVQPSASNTKAVRAVFFIDPNSKVRALIYYPLTNGRNFDEIKRLLVAMQTSDKYKVATPADWRPGEEVIDPIPSGQQAIDDRYKNAEKLGLRCVDWYLCFKKLPPDASSPSNLSIAPAAGQ